jgi:hypothetical protein
VGAVFQIVMEMQMGRSTVWTSVQPMAIKLPQAFADVVRLISTAMVIQ